MGEVASPDLTFWLHRVIIIGYRLQKMMNGFSSLKTCFLVAIRYWFSPFCIKLCCKKEQLPFLLAIGYKDFNYFTLIEILPF